MAIPDSAYPGLILGPSSSYTAGPGTHIYEGQVCASVLGSVTQDASMVATSAAGTTALPTLRVARPPPTAITSRTVSSTSLLPGVGSVVLARVTRLQTRQISLAITVVDDQVCGEALQGIVRKEDVRGWEIDRVVMGEAFRVGDIVRAVVISLGDQASYYLSTAQNELGVLLATSEAGNQMYPVSWKEFKDPETGKLEARKVAKPI